MIQLSDMKTYLRVDGEQDDIVLQHLMETAQALCREILRTSTPEQSRMPVSYTHLTLPTKRIV